MSYGLLLTLHLLAAIAFAGTVFFEVVLLAGARRHLSADVARATEQALGHRAVAVMPWVLMVLYGAGMGLAWHHRAALAPVFSAPLASGFGLMLAFKIMLALSVFGHFLAAMWWRRRGRLGGRRSHRLHLSVFGHVLAIVLLAKAMFYLGW